MYKEYQRRTIHMAEHFEQMESGRCSGSEGIFHIHTGVNGCNSPIGAY